MSTSALPLLALCTLFAACSGTNGTDNNEAFTDNGQGGMSELEARVAAITGQGLPADQYAPTSGAQYAQGDAAHQQMQGQPGQQGQVQGGTRTHTIHSKQFNVPMAQMELPARWNVRTLANGDWEANAPGIVVKNMGGQSFMYATGEFAYYYQNAGGKMRAPVAPELVVKQDMVPHWGKQGFEFMGQSEVPAIARADQQGMDGLYSIGQNRKTSRAVVSEWRKGDTRSAVVVHWYAMEGGDMVNWGYRLTGLEAPSASYEQEKGALLAGLASLRYNPAYFAAYARGEQQQEQQSWGAHNERMRSNQAAFDAQQRAHRDQVNSTNDAMMNSYWSNSRSSDRQHDATIDMIRGEQNAVDPYTGQPIKVESGATNYWMNNNGQYIGTNDVLYDPRLHGDHSDQWREMPTEP